MAEEVSIDIKIQAAEGAQTIGELKKSIQDLQAAAFSAGEAGNDALANKYIKAAGDAQFKIKELNNDINDVVTSSKAMDAIAGVGKTIASGFAAAEGAAALFGASQEEVQKQILKIQAAQAIADGIQQVSELGKQARLLKNTVLLELEGAAQSKNIVISKAAAAAQWLINAAMNANPIALIVAGVAALILAYQKLTDQTKDLQKATVEANQKMLDSTKERYKNEVELAKAQGKNTDELEIKQEAALIAHQTRNAKYLLSIKERSEEEQKALDTTLEGVRESTQRIQVLRAEANTKKREEEKKADEEEKKAHEEAAKKAEERRLKKEQDDAAALEKENQRIKALQDLYAKSIEENEAAEKEAAAKKEEERLAAEEKSREVKQSQIDEEIAYQDTLLLIQTKGDEATTAQLLAAEDAKFALQMQKEGLHFEEIERLKAEHEAKKNQITKDGAAKDLATQQALRDALFQIAQSTLDIAKAAGEIFIKDQAKLEKFQKKAALVQIGIDTAKAISSVVAAASVGSLTPIDLAAKIIAGSAVVFTNIAKAKKLLDGSSAGSTIGGGLLGGFGTLTKPKNVSLGTGGGSGNTDTGGGSNNTRLPRTNNTQTTTTPTIPPAVKPICPPCIGTGSSQFDEDGNPINQTIKAFVVETELTATQKNVEAIKKRNVF